MSQDQLRRLSDRRAETSWLKSPFPSEMGRLKWAGVIVVALAGLAVLGWVSYSRAAFGTWNPMAQPSRVDYCDRRYFPGWHFTRARIDSRGNGLGVFPFRQVATTPGGAPIFAKPLPDGLRHETPTSGPLPCAMTVYIKAGPDDYLAYGISGGP